MGFILLAIGIVLIFEGLVYALAPSLLERLLEAIRTLPKGALRQIGVLACVAGLVLIWGAFQVGL